ncbi:MAG: tetratricopeptide repeat protein, partial [Longimicrobiales bacterium]
MVPDTPLPGDSTPDTIGPYRILDRLGVGGMGVVYLAQQDRPVRRRVALKILKAGMDTEQIVARFESERQALAVMDHPNIAKVFGGGSTEQGRPYFVMELVQGDPIAEYADGSRLTTRQRIELFIGVCRAVQHAHLKGVIHRDLKPSNILVSTPDESPVAKVIDFGIAKATGGSLTDRTIYTQIGHFVGTPHYMSPEQADASGLDVDSRTDIYSLGVVLYELLVGSVPIDLSAVPPAAVPFAILERDPVTPSTRFTKTGDTGHELARLRRTDPVKLTRELKGDLDWIVMKAMSKDRNRRYETALGLALDLERHLADQPVLARPPTMSYRVGKFVRRHKAGVGFAAASAVLIVSAAAALGVQSRVVVRERDRAEAEAARTAAINDFMEETLLSPDPLTGLGRDVTVAEALSHAAGQVDSTLGGAPMVAASARSAIGWAFHQLGRYEEAEPLLTSALRQRESLLQPNDPALAESQFQWAQLLASVGQFDEAESALERALSSYREAEQQGQGVVDALVGLGDVLAEVGRLDEAEERLREAMAIAEAHGTETRTVASIMTKLGVVLWNRGEQDDVGPLWERALEIRRSLLGPEHPEVGEVMNNLAVLYDNTGQPERAEPLYRQVLALQQRLLGPEHEEVTAVMMNLAILLDGQGRMDEAETLYRDVLRIDRGRLGPDHLIVSYDMVDLGAFLCWIDKAEEGTRLIRESIPISRTNLEQGHWRLGNARQWLGLCLTKLGQYPEAELEIRAGMDVLTRALGADHFRIAAARRKLVDLYEVWG